MQKEKSRIKGFTLIELLVVVLIIGILASVALPQYQMAVKRSRYRQVLLLADALKKAQAIYFLANGSYTTDYEALDIDFPPPDRVDITSGGTTLRFSWGYCSLTANYMICLGDWPTLSMWYATGERRCIAGSAKDDKFCQIETGKSTPDVVASDGRRYIYP